MTAFARLTAGCTRRPQAAAGEPGRQFDEAVEWGQQWDHLGHFLALAVATARSGVAYVVEP
jgi:hypothetical protein